MGLTIVIRSYNEMPHVPATLNNLLIQRRQDFGVIVIDTGSTDGSVEVFKEFAQGPGKKYNFELIEIPVEEYNPGRVLNMGIGKSPHDIVVLLNADATPVDEFWLERLVEPFAQDEEIAATFSRVLPRDDTKPLVVADIERFFPEKGELPKWKHYVHYSHISNAIRKKCWEEHPVTTACKMTCEDAEWGLWALQKGYRIQYVPASLVYHAHNYTLGRYYRRMFREGEDSVQVFRDARPGMLRGLKSFAGAVLRDVAWCVRRGHILSALYSPILRITQQIARYRGQRRGIRARSREMNVT
ncbi:MAG: glycosyltransferase family 2 protein [Planctomycetota bacterium]